MRRSIFKQTALEPAKRWNADLLIGSFPAAQRNLPIRRSALPFLARRWQWRAAPVRRLPVAKWELHKYCCEINDGSPPAPQKMRTMTLAGLPFLN